MKTSGFDVEMKIFAQLCFLGVFWCHISMRCLCDKSIPTESNIHGNLRCSLISATRLIFSENPVLIERKLDLNSKISLWGEIVVWTTLKDRFFKASPKAHKICRDYDGKPGDLIEFVCSRKSWIFAGENASKTLQALKAHMSFYWKLLKLQLLRLPPNSFQSNSHHSKDRFYDVERYHNVAWRDLICAFKNN